MNVFLACSIITVGLMLIWQPGILSRLLVSAGFVALGLAGWVERDFTLREIWGDLRFLWGPGSDGDIYYGVDLTDE
jgi:hypothetical protein